MAIKMPHIGRTDTENLGYLARSFTELLPAMLPEHQGEWAVLGVKRYNLLGLRVSSPFQRRGALGFYGSYSEALRSACMEYGPESSFLVRQVSSDCPSYHASEVQTGERVDTTNFPRAFFAPQS